MLLPIALTILLVGTLIIKISTQIHSSFENLEPVKVENKQIISSREKKRN
jgi:hypothetical protein